MGCTESRRVRGFLARRWKSDVRLRLGLVQVFSSRPLTIIDQLTHKTRHLARNYYMSNQAYRSGVPELTITAEVRLCKSPACESSATLCVSPCPPCALNSSN